MIREDRETFSSYGKDVFMNHDEEFHDEKKIRRMRMDN